MWSVDTLGVSHLQESFRSASYRLLTTKYLRPLVNSPGKSSVNISFFMMHGAHTPRLLHRADATCSSIDIDALKTNLRFLARDYSVISLDSATEMITGRREWQKRCAVLTFDDSLKCHLTVTAPLLAEMGLPAMFYISTQTIDLREPYWWTRLEYAFNHATTRHKEIELPSGRYPMISGKWRDASLAKLKGELKSMNPDQVSTIMATVESELGISLLDMIPRKTEDEVLTRDDVRRLQKLGMSIGSHSVTHANLTLLSPGELRRELEGSRASLEALCQAPVKHLCYPYGCYSSVVCEAAAASGYLSGVTADEPGWNPAGSDPFRLRRFNMPTEPYKIPYLLSRLSPFR